MEKQNTIIEGYIPERFKTTFRGFPKQYPYEEIARIKKAEQRKNQLVKRSNYKHSSRGGISVVKTISYLIIQGKDIDYRYDGEEEYYINVFNEKKATNEVIKYLKRKGVFKYLL